MKRIMATALLLIAAAASPEVRRQGFTPGLGG